MLRVTVCTPYTSILAVCTMHHKSNTNCTAALFYIVSLLCHCVRSNWYARLLHTQFCKMKVNPIVFVRMSQTHHVFCTPCAHTLLLVHLLNTLCTSFVHLMRQQCTVACFTVAQVLPERSTKRVTTFTSVNAYIVHCTCTLHRCVNLQCKT